jgi:ribonuclease D
VALKRWRARRASELALDPGVLCPNAALEAVAAKNPTAAEELTGLPELKPWLVREFGSELVAELRADRDAERTEAAG